MTDEYKGRVSVRRDVLIRLKTYIEFGCYEQVCEMIDDLLDDDKRKVALEKADGAFYGNKGGENKRGKGQGLADLFF